MARCRIASPTLHQDEVLAETGSDGFKTYIGLLNEADREGRLENRPKRLRVQIFPYHPSVDNLTSAERTDFPGYGLGDWRLAGAGGQSANTSHWTTNPATRVTATRVSVRTGLPYREVWKANASAARGSGATQ